MEHLRGPPMLVLAMWLAVFSPLLPTFIYFFLNPISKTAQTLFCVHHLNIRTSIYNYYTPNWIPIVNAHGVDVLCYSNVLKSCVGLTVNYFWKYLLFIYQKFKCNYTQQRFFKKNYIIYHFFIIIFYTFM